MQSLNRQKILLGVLAIVVIVAVIYYSNLWKSTSVGEVLTMSGQEEVVGQDVLVIVNKLRQVTIDPSIFSDPLFTSLKDISITINPENQARFNPFAPIGVETGGDIQSWVRTSTTNQ